MILASLWPPHGPENRFGFTPTASIAPNTSHRRPAAHRRVPRVRSFRTGRRRLPLLPPHHLIHHKQQHPNTAAVMSQPHAARRPRRAAAALGAAALLLGLEAVQGFIGRPQVAAGWGAVVRCVGLDASIGEWWDLDGLGQVALQLAAPFPRLMYPSTYPTPSQRPGGGRATASSRAARWPTSRGRSSSRKRVSRPSHHSTAAVR